MTTSDPFRRILLTGATGYVGGRLLPALLASDHLVRCMTRRPGELRNRVSDKVEVVAGDVGDPDSLRSALLDVYTAYYLVHSMAAGERFAQRDREAARHFAAAADACGVKRIIYLGGLGGGEHLSKHLSSRQEVGEILRASKVPTLEFRASIIVGSGSLSFEMIRSLVDRLPVMITPRWVRTRAQPIAIETVIRYLVAALTWEGASSEVFEIGGRDRASYREIMMEYARQRGLRRVMIPVPVLTPRLSSMWLRLVTPLHARVGRSLIDGLRNETIVRDDRATRVFHVELMGLREAIERALVNEDEQFAQTRWSDARSSSGITRKWGGVRFGSRLVDTRAETVEVPPERAFVPIRGIGGRRGWYYGNWLWKLRGFIDLLVGGVGLRRGRRDPDDVRVGDTLDFWRVEAIEPNRLLRLSAEMKVPGRAWLQFEVEASGEGSTIRQTAIFDPAGLFGLAYWYGLYPLHVLVFRGMLRSISRYATTGTTSDRPERSS